MRALIKASCARTHTHTQAQTYQGRKLLHWTMVETEGRGGRALDDITTRASHVFMMREGVSDSKPHQIYVRFYYWCWQLWKNSQLEGCRRSQNAKWQCQVIPHFCVKDCHGVTLHHVFDANALSPPPLYSRASHKNPSFIYINGTNEVTHLIHFYPKSWMCQCLMYALLSIHYTGFLASTYKLHGKTLMTILRVG